MRGLGERTVSPTTSSTAAPTRARIAAQLAPHQLGEFQRAARLLLRRPLITSKDPEAFAMVRRWEQVLGNEFSQKFGYRLDVSRTAARLLRRPASLSAQRGARLPNGRPMSRWGYVYFALVLAALEQPGRQVLASELLDRIEQRARGDDHLSLDSRDYAQRKGFSDAVKYLGYLGVLTVRDGDVDSIVDDGQVLFDIDRDAAAMCLVASPSILREVTTVDDFIATPTSGSTAVRSTNARQRLNRRLIDQPVVTVDDLDDDEYQLAWRNRRREADNITRLTGCDVELRAEGMALIDVQVEPVSGDRFPGNDSVAHASLLWLDRMLTALDNHDGLDEPDHLREMDDLDRADEGLHDRPADGIEEEELDTAALLRRPPSIAGRRLARRDSDRAWDEMFADYGTRFARDARERPERFKAQCVELLDRFGLVRRSENSARAGHVEISAAGARYRAVASMPTPKRHDPNQQELFT
jgi:uncharacterized protein (TIGR02678 family)